MAVNVPKSMHIIFHTRSKPICNTFKVLCEDNEPNEQKHDLIYELECVYSNHIVLENRSYKLLGIHLDKRPPYQIPMYKLNKSFYCIPPYSLVDSHLSYCACNTNILTI